MGDVVATVGIGIGVFASTNVDDLLLLAAFFADRRWRTGAVVAGQFLGIAALTAASATAALLAFVVPPGVVALLGLLPLALGVRSVWRLRRRSAAADTNDDNDAPPAAPRRAATGQALAIAAVTIANGGDNLGV